MRRAISTVHISMNTFAGVDRLPPEVLALIPAYLSSRELVSSTHVCRRWRDAFVASPSLWTTLDNEQMHRDALAVYLTRCGGAPIDVAFSTSRNKNLAFLRLVAPRSTQIRSMKIPSLPWSQVSEISDSISLPLPLLEQVEISVKREESIPVLSQQLLGGALRLRSLTLLDASWIPGTLFHFSFPSLTHVHLSFIETRTHMVAELQEFLGGSPLLERVHIAVGPTYGTPIDSSTPPRVQRVNLGSLHALRLDWLSNSSPYTLLSSISYPSNCSISLCIESESDFSRPPRGIFPKTWGDFSLIPEVSEITLRMGLGETITECSISLVKTNGASISISHTQDLGIHYMWDEGKGSMYAASLCRDRDDYRTLLEAVASIQKLPLPGVRKFAVEGSDEKTFPIMSQSQAPFATLLTNMPNLETLSLNNVRVSQFLKILRPPAPLLPPPSYLRHPDISTTLLCPALEVLELRHQKWELDPHAEEVLDIIEARTNGGIPLKRLFLCSDYVPEGLIDRLSARVEEIEVRTCRKCCFCRAVVSPCDM